MRRILLLIILSLVFCFEAFGQDCPAIKVIPPSKFPEEKGSMLFSVSVIGKIYSSKLEYNWSVSNGTIFDGQGTSAITVPRDKNSEGEIIATVKVNGLPDGCKNIFSEGFMIPIKAVCRCNDEYGKIPWLEELARLENMVSELIADQKAKAYFIFSYKTDKEKRLVSNREKKILAFLETRKISSSRILVTIRKEGGYYTTIKILPEGSELPN